MDIPARSGDILLGKYRVERVLGEGGMGVVVAARHLGLGELFAIKLLRPAPRADGKAIERFLREARAAARLKTEHVARVHDVGRLDGGAPYMVMEHLDGNDLKAVVRARGPLPIEEALTCVLQACEAIAEAHSSGIVHRDLKPANLFLCRRPNGDASLKVLDFGISKHTGPDDVELTRTGAILGSPSYMSPEQMTLARSADARSDVWSVGVTLYELVTGQLPFQGETITEIITRVLHEEPPAPRIHRPELSADLDTAILRCLRKRPDERFQGIRELAAALREAGAKTGADTRARLTDLLLPANPGDASPPNASSGSPWGTTAPPETPSESTAFSVSALPPSILDRDTLTGPYHPSPVPPPVSVSRPPEPLAAAAPRGNAGIAAIALVLGAAMAVLGFAARSASKPDLLTATAALAPHASATAPLPAPTTEPVGLPAAPHAPSAAPISSTQRAPRTAPTRQPAHQVLLKPPAPRPSAPEPPAATDTPPAPATSTSSKKRPRSIY